MVDPLAMYYVGVAQSAVCVMCETMRQIDIGKMDIRALAVQRAVGRELLSLVATLPRSPDSACSTAQHACLAQVVAYVAYLDALEERDNGAAEQKHADYCEAATHLTPAIKALIERMDKSMDRLLDRFMLTR